MKNIDIINALRNLYPSAVMVRVNKTNCLCIPTEDTQDGIPVYKRILVGNFAVKATERSAAFDFDTAKQDYETWEKEAAVRAAKHYAVFYVFFDYCKTFLLFHNALRDFFYHYMQNDASGCKKNRPASGR